MVRPSAVALAILLAGCASTPPPTPQSAARMQALSDELRAIEARICEQNCEREVLGTCVMRAIEGPVQENCVQSQALACLINCAH